MRKININYIHFNKDAMIIGWSATNIGFGQLTIFTENEHIYVDSECMSKEFCEDVLKTAAKFILKDFEADK